MSVDVACRERRMFLQRLMELSWISVSVSLF